MKILRRPPASQVENLLRECQLPGSDITSGKLEHFFGLCAAQTLRGVVGLELYVDVALLRSLAVGADYRGLGYAKALVAEAERYAQAKGIRGLYLLTDTAERFFERLGYERRGREKAPEAIRQTKEFAELCPSTSTFMVKELGACTLSRTAD